MAEFITFPFKSSQIVIHASTPDFLKATSLLGGAVPVRIGYATIVPGVMYLYIYTHTVYVSSSANEGAQHYQNKEKHWEVMICVFAQKARRLMARILATERPASEGSSLH